MTYRRFLPFLSLTVLSAGSLASALLIQIEWGAMPCAWCIIQRIAYLGLLITGILGLVTTSANLRLTARFTAFYGIFISIFGMWAAFQQIGAVKNSNNCGVSIANKWLMEIDLESISKVFFQVKANCSDAAFPIAGIPMEWVSMAGFALAFFICVPATIKEKAIQW